MPRHRLHTASGVIAHAAVASRPCTRRLQRLLSVVHTSTHLYQLAVGDGASVWLQPEGRDQHAHGYGHADAKRIKDGISTQMQVPAERQIQGPGPGKMVRVRQRSCGVTPDVASAPGNPPSPLAQGGDGAPCGLTASFLAGICVYYVDESIGAMYAASIASPKSAGVLFSLHNNLLHCI